MKVRHLLAATTVAAGLAVLPAAPASAHWDVMLGTNGSCPSGYGEWAQAGSTTVCIHGFLPDATVVTNGEPCPTGYTEVSALDFYRVCLKLDH